jgi:hypothetical protein
MNLFIRLKDKSNWSVTIRVDLTFQGYGKGYWNIFDKNDPWGLLCLRNGGWFDFDASTGCMDFQCQDSYGTWVTCFFLCDAPACRTDEKHISGDGMVGCPANPVGKGLLIDWYRLDQTF